MKAPSLLLALVLSMLLMLNGISYAGDDDDTISSSQVQQGFAISPVPKDKLNFSGKSEVRVGLGSYLVNAIGDCSGCHSFPQYLEQGNTAGSNPSAGDPYEGKPSAQSVSQQLVANFNVSHYLAGGQCFGPYMARNLTPDENGLPQGLTEEEFIKVIRTGEDIHCEKSLSDPICAIPPDTLVLQVMPWPTYHSMTDFHLRAIYAYLTAIPSAQACNSVVPWFFRSSGQFHDLCLPEHQRLPKSAPATISSVRGTRQGGDPLAARI
jgi:hypothetical protein